MLAKLNEKKQVDANIAVTRLYPLLLRYLIGE
jgi:hypothetical protein